MAHFKLAVVIAVITAVLGGCSRRPDHYNLVLITVDTLRPDHLGFGGCPRETSPTIDRLAAEGMVFPNHYSQAGWTLPAVATILTGRYPKDHGATDFHWSLDGSLPTLASILRRSGYTTLGYVSHLMLTPTYGFGEGFSRFDYTVLNVGHPHDVATARELTDLAIEGVRGAGKPYFLWVHYFDPHFEYLSHPAFASFGNSDIDRYDGEIAHTDFHIARLLKNLPDKAHTIIVFTSDHGEEFGEHGGQFHETLYEEVMRAPLVIQTPFLEPGVDRSVTEEIDLLPTMLALLKIAPPEGLPGRDLLNEPATGKPVFFERDRPTPWRQRGVLHGNLKLCVVEVADSAEIPPSSRGNYKPVQNVFPGIYLYDLAQDPEETRNLYHSSDPRAKELLALVTAHFGTRRYAETEVQPSEELLKKLRSLGYLR